MAMANSQSTNLFEEFLAQAQRLNISQENVQAYIDQCFERHERQLDRQFQESKIEKELNLEQVKLDRERLKQEPNSDNDNEGDDDNSSQIQGNQNLGVTGPNHQNYHVLMRRLMKWTPGYTDLKFMLQP